jgi:hypothetical protein
LETVVLLEQFAAAFTRDVTPRVAIRIKEKQRKLDEIYKSPTVAALKDLYEWRNFESFRSQFIALYKVLEQQLLSIRHSRRDLFNMNRCNEWECDIDLGLTWCDEEVDFTVNEPCYDIYNVRTN